MTTTKPPVLTDEVKDRIYNAWQDKRDEASYGDLIDAIEQAVLERAGADAVRDAALDDAIRELEKRRALLHGQFESLNITEADAMYGLCIAAIRALKGTPAAAVPALPDRDPSLPAEEQGLFRKFDVRRTDGSDAPGGKHHGCRYFVLDVDHDAHAGAALAAYADACEGTHPELAHDLRDRWGAGQVSGNAGEVASPRDEAMRRIDDTVRNRMTDFGLLVRAMRVTAGVMLYDMAKYMGVSSATLSGMETGRHPVGPETVREVAAFFRANGLPDVTELLTVAAIAASKERASRP